MRDVPYGLRSAADVTNIDLTEVAVKVVASGRISSFPETIAGAHAHGFFRLMGTAGSAKA